jgi:hypothetical protein
MRRNMGAWLHIWTNAEYFKQRQSLQLLLRWVVHQVSLTCRYKLHDEELDSGAKREVVISTGITKVGGNWMS